MIGEETGSSPASLADSKVKTSLMKIIQNSAKPPTLALFGYSSRVRVRVIFQL
jgi:hypothetical protein